MNLFFETSRQSIAFLLCIPIGFLISLGLGSRNGRGWMQFAVDFTVLAAGALGFMLLFVCADERTLRVYHVLGALCGALLYAMGFYRIQMKIRQIMQRKRQEKDNPKTK